MKVELTAPARTDLRDIAGYIARDNPSRARSFTAELRDKALATGDTPFGFSVIRKYGPYDLRRRPYGDYAIFYVVRANKVQVIRILHSARDIDTLL